MIEIPVWFIPIWMLCGAVIALSFYIQFKFKRPKRCSNCGLRPKWVFDTTARQGPELLRDHRKECLG